MGSIPGLCRLQGQRDFTCFISPKESLPRPTWSLKFIQVRRQEGGLLKLHVFSEISRNTVLVIKKDFGSPLFLIKSHE